MRGNDKYSNQGLCRAKMPPRLLDPYCLPLFVHGNTGAGSRMSYHTFGRATDRAVTCPYLFVAVEDLRPLDISSQRGLRPLEPLLTLPARQCLPLAGVPMLQRFNTSTFPQYSTVR